MALLELEDDIHLHNETKLTMYDLLKQHIKGHRVSKLIIFDDEKKQ